MRFKLGRLALQGLVNARLCFGNALLRGGLASSLMSSGISKRVPKSVIGGGGDKASDVGRHLHAQKDVSLIENYSDNVPGYTGRR